MSYGRARDGATLVTDLAADDTAADYLMDHSVFTYLMGPDGEYVAHFGHDATPEEMAERLREVVSAEA